MKKILKQTFSMLLTVVIVLTAAPLAGFVGLKLPEIGKIFAVKANAATEYISGYYTYTVDKNGNATITDVNIDATSGDITIPSKLGGYIVTELAFPSFAGDYDITSVVIPNTVKTIGEQVFSNCKLLNKVIIPDSVLSIGYAAFRGCKALEGVVIPDSVTSIGGDAFSNCWSLSNVEIGNGVTSIGEGAFCFCDLSNITLGNAVTSIGNGAFQDNSNLKSFFIPKSVANIGEWVFLGCDSLENITVETGNEHFFSDEYGVLFDKNRTILIHCPSASPLTSYTVPQSVEEIILFRGNDNIVSLILYNNIKSIHEMAFSGCFNLENVYFVGAEKEWKAISIGSNNECLSNATIHYNYVPVGDEVSPPTDDDVHNQNIKVMSYNVYSKNENDYAYSNRAKYIAQNIMDNSPDSVGLQEVTGDFFKLFYGDDVEDNDSLGQTELGKKYGFVGDFRNGGKYQNGKAVATKNDGGNNEACLILYDKTKYDLIESDTFWLSKNPDEISFGWIKENKNYRRICTYALLKNKTTGNVYAHFNTHISHNETNALKSMQLITEYIEKNFAGIPVALTGDFNFKEPNKDNIRESEEAAYFVLTDSKYKNVKNLVSQSEDTASYHDYNRGGAPKTIDFIFVNEYASAVSYDVYDKNYSNNGLKIKYASDHHPIVAELKISKAITANVNFESEDGTKGHVNVRFNEEWFGKKNKEYNHALSRFCADYVMMGYCYNDKKMKDYLSQMGFDTVDSCMNTGRDEVNYFIASKDIIVNGKEETLVFAGFIGSYKNQWYSNFDPYATERDSWKDRNAPYADINEKGKVHLGFADAREYVYARLKEFIIDNNISKDNMKLLLSGHSRGAATANLLAAKLIDEHNSQEAIVCLDDIYTYTFATPNTASTENNVFADKYKRIFNIVNPEDFVTKVLLNDWGYYRYGKTFVLPSRTNDKNWRTYLGGMNSLYWQYSDGNEYEPYPDGEKTTVKILKKISGNINDIDAFYEDYFYASDIFNSDLSDKNYAKATPFEFFKNTLLDFLTEKNVVGAVSTILTVILEPFSKFYKDILLYFLEIDWLDTNLNPDINLDFAQAHGMETYVAYMNSMTSSQIKQTRLYYENTVNCPVDIEIYDNETNELVGRITNNVIDSTIAAKENAIVMDVEGDSKSFWLPSNGDYRVVLTGNDKGTMDYTVSDIDSDTGETIRANFFDVEIENDVSMTGKFISNNTTVENYTLVHEEDGTIKPTEIIGKEQLQKFTIITSAEGNGIADDELTATSGDYVTVFAYPGDGGYFTGWYENGKLVSTDIKYSFVAKENRNLVAKFADFAIFNPSTTTISYGDSIILHVDASKIPEGGYVEWTTDNANFTITKTSADGKTCTVTPSVSGETTFTATVYDADGNAVGTDTQTMTAKAGFFQKIIAFFKKLFGLTKIIPEAFRTEI